MPTPTMCPSRASAPGAEPSASPAQAQLTPRSRPAQLKPSSSPRGTARTGRYPATPSAASGWLLGLCTGGPVGCRWVARRRRGIGATVEP